MTAADPAAQPTAAPTEQPPRSGRLLALVRRLIDYGRELAATLQQRSATTDLTHTFRIFGTIEVALILARIRRGLQLAEALEARVTRTARRLEAGPRPAKAAAPHRAPTASPPEAAPARPTATGLADLPTPQQIAAAVRRRPIGAVVADICLDLGTMPSHPLWREVQSAIIHYRGSLARLVKDCCHQVFALAVGGSRIAEDVAPPIPAAAGTGPP